MMKEESLQKSTVTPNLAVFTGPMTATKANYMQAVACQGNHRYFVAETFAVEGEGTVGAIVICTACGESKVIIRKVAGHSSSISLKEK